MEKPEVTKNCHGCKWLDEVSTVCGDRRLKWGGGYCVKVMESQSYCPGARVRCECDNRCELYEEGDFKRRYDDKKGV